VPWTLKLIVSVTLACSYRASLAAKVTLTKRKSIMRSGTTLQFVTTFGTQKKGLESLIYELIDNIYPEVFASFAMHLGAEGLQRLYADHGLGVIDCSDMAATLLRLEKEQVIVANSPKSIVTIWRRQSSDSESRCRSRWT
jgi:hypothetical protein